MAYKLMKVVIARGGYDTQDITDKLDAYLAFGRITLEQYNELVAMVETESDGDDTTDETAGV